MLSAPMQCHWNRYRTTNNCITYAITTWCFHRCTTDTIVISPTLFLRPLLWHYLLSLPRWHWYCHRSTHIVMQPKHSRLFRSITLTQRLAPFHRRYCRRCHTENFVTVARLTMVLPALFWHTETQKLFLQSQCWHCFCRNNYSIVAACNVKRCRRNLIHPDVAMLPLPRVSSSIHCHVFGSAALTLVWDCVIAIITVLYRYWCCRRYTDTGDAQQNWSDITYSDVATRSFTPM